jgi:hypothetical protein
VLIDWLRALNELNLWILSLKTGQKLVDSRLKPDSLPGIMIIPKGIFIVNRLQPLLTRHDSTKLFLEGDKQKGRLAVNNNPLIGFVF